MTSKPTFEDFYTNIFIPEHQNPWNVGFHAVGVFSSLALIGLVAAKKLHPLYLLTYPGVVAVPGLIGHRLFERNEVIGDARFLRKDYPLHYFLIGNYYITWDLIFRPSTLFRKRS
jgi:hypothetical protein